MKATLTLIKEFHHWTQPDDLVGILGSVVPYENRFIGATRTGRASIDDMISITHYSSDFCLQHIEEVTKGEDPRCFLWNKTPYAVCWDPDPHTHYLKYKLINLATKEVSLLNIENIESGPLSLLGKNWMPLVKDNELYIVISIDPQLNIVKYDATTKMCAWIPPSNFIGQIDVTQYRGGTPFVFYEPLGCFVGLGHKTYNSHYHTPYLYSLDASLQSVRIWNEIFTGKQVAEDPLSAFVVDNKVYCCVSNWDVPGSGYVSLYQLNFE